MIHHCPLCNTDWDCECGECNHHKQHICKPCQKRYGLKDGELNFAEAETRTLEELRVASAIMDKLRKGTFYPPGTKFIGEEKHE